MGGTEDGDDIVRFALGLLDHVKTIRLSKEVSEGTTHLLCGMKHSTELPRQLPNHVFSRLARRIQKGPPSLIHTAHSVHVLTHVHVSLGHCRAAKHTRC